jgi:O-antigen/teichoic acid export membrane protein
LGQAVALVLGVTLLPGVIRALGPGPYALYAFVGLLGGYAVLLTLGGGDVTVRLLSDARASGDKGRVAEALGTSLAHHVVGAVLGVGLLWSARGFFAGRLLDVPAELAGAAAAVFAAAAVAAAGFCFIQWGLSALQGAQAFGASTALGTLRTALPLTGSWVLLSRGGTLTDVACWLAAAYAGLAVLVMGAAALTLAGEGLLVRPKFRLDGAALRFGALAWLTQLSWSALFQADRVVLGAFVPLADLGYYMVPVAVAQYFQVFGVSVASVVMPSVSELARLGRTEDIRRIYVLGSRLLVWLALPVFTLAAILAPHLLTLWLAPEFAERGGHVLRALLVGQLAYLAAAMPNVVDAGAAQGRVRFTATAASAALALAGWLFVAPRWGAFGMAAVTAAALAAGALYSLWAVHGAQVPMRLREYVAGVWAGPALSAAACAAVAWPLRAQAFGLLGLTAVCAAGGAAYLACAPWVWPAADRKAVSAAWKGG